MSDKNVGQIFVTGYQQGDHRIRTKSYAVERRAQEQEQAQKQQDALAALILSWYESIHHSHTCPAYIHRDEQGEQPCECWLGDSAKTLAARLIASGYHR